MRLATWNILSGRRPGDLEVDPDAYAAAVRTLDADVLGLQEVDLGQPRSRGIDLTRVAAEAMGAVDAVFAPALTGLPQQWEAAAVAGAAGGPAYGIALLSRFPVRSHEVVRLAGAPARVPYRWPGNTMPSLVRDEPRVAIVAVVDTLAGPLRVVTTHLSFLPVWNGVQLRRLLRALPPPDLPMVLLGDLNMGRGRAERLTRLRPLVKGATFPAHSPERQIDHLLARGLGLATGGPVLLDVSDHRALVADC